MHTIYRHRATTKTRLIWYFSQSSNCAARGFELNPGHIYIKESRSEKASWRTARHDSDDADDRALSSVRFVRLSVCPASEIITLSVSRRRSAPKAIRPTSVSARHIPGAPSGNPRTDGPHAPSAMKPRGSLLICTGPVSYTHLTLPTKRIV